jgi:hypothetical protein
MVVMISHTSITPNFCDRCESRDILSKKPLVYEETKGWFEINLVLTYPYPNLALLTNL